MSEYLNLATFSQLSDADKQLKRNQSLLLNYHRNGDYVQKHQDFIQYLKDHPNLFDYKILSHFGRNVKGYHFINAIQEYHPVLHPILEGINQSKYKQKIDWISNLPGDILANNDAFFEKMKGVIQKLNHIHYYKNATNKFNHYKESDYNNDLLFIKNYEDNIKQLLSHADHEFIQQFFKHAIIKLRDFEAIHYLISILQQSFTDRHNELTVTQDTLEQTLMQLNETQLENIRRIIVYHDKTNHLFQDHQLALKTAFHCMFCQYILTNKNPKNIAGDTISRIFHLEPSVLDTAFKEKVKALLLTYETAWDKTREVSLFLGKGHSLSILDFIPELKQIKKDTPFHLIHLDQLQLVMKNCPSAPDTIHHAEIEL